MKWLAVLICVAATGCDSAVQQLRSAVNTGDYEEASLLYRLHKSNYLGKPRETEPLLQETADHLNAALNPALQEATRALQATVWPGDAAQWPSSESALKSASGLLNRYMNHDILREARFESEDYRALQAAHAATLASATEAAPEAFAAFDHFSGANFFDAYPVHLRPQPFMATNFSRLVPSLERATSDQIRQFGGLYRTALTKQDWRTVSNLYVAAQRRETHPDGLEGTLAIAAEARKEGFEPSEGLRIALWTVAPQDTHSRLVEFAADVQADVPVERIAGEPNQVVMDYLKGRFDYVVVFRVVSATSTRQAVGQEEIKSTYVVHVDRLPNPAYDRALVDIQTLQGQLVAGGQQGGVAGLVVRARLKAARENLARTPMYIEKPVYSVYTYHRDHIAVQKHLTATCCLVDSAKDAYCAKDVSLADSAQFKLLNGLHPKDAEPGRYADGTVSGDEFAAWEEQPMVVKLSQVIAELSDPAAGQTFSPLNTLPARMAEKQAVIQVQARAEDPTAADGPRFASVVVVRTPDGNGGSGFFVTEGIVLTNYHVIENAPYLEVKLRNGAECLGKTVSTDVRRDLALLRVPITGKPVRFFDEPEVPLGATVEAIGHPHGLDFSITRGIVSALRREPSQRVPSAEPVLFVQTDAAVNPGNSGGPLFLEGAVIGVSTRGQPEGLHRAVHVSEVLAFIHDALGDR